MSARSDRADIVRYAGGMDEQQITFRDREIVVRMPTPEQLLVWGRTVAMLDSPEVKDWNGEQVMRALERGRKIIDSVLSDRADREWLDDLMLEGSLSLADAAAIIQLTLDQFTGDKSDAPAKKATPRKRAARRKATA